MLLQKANTLHITSVVHERKVVVFAINETGEIFYTVKQDGFEDTALNQKTEAMGWENWQKLTFPNDNVDDSVTAQEKIEQTYVDEMGVTHYLLRSHYKTVNESALAPIQVVSGFGCLYLFRQSKSSTLLVDRFVLDGMTNRLVRKLEVRYKRSRKKYQPLLPTSSSQTNGSAPVDSLDFQDSNGQPFFEPTTEVSLINFLTHGWFSVILLPTNEHDRYRWHIFAYNQQTQKVELISIRASQDGLFEMTDDLVFMPKPGQEGILEPHRVAGIMRRSLLLQDQNGKDIPITGGFAATKYDLQVERQTQAGAQLLREAMRVMLAVPTQAGNTVTLCFAVALDGTLAQIETLPQTKLLRSLNQTVLLPLDTLELVKAFAKSKSAAQGMITKMERTDADDRVKVFFKGNQSPTDDDVVKISGTTSYDGHYSITKIDEKTFEIRTQWQGQEIGNWQVLPKEESGLIFNGSITAFEQTSDGKLRITAPGHGLETGDEVQIANLPTYNSTYPIVQTGADYFVLDGKWQLAEAINLQLESRKRRGIQFVGEQDCLEIASLALPLPSEERSLNRTYSAWIYYNPVESSTPQLIVGQSDRTVDLVIQQGKAVLRVQTLQGIVEVADPKPVPSETWIHYAGVVSYAPETRQTTLALYRNGIEAASQSTSQAIVAGTASALELDGTQDCIKLGNFQQITGQITLSAWVKPTANDGFHNIIAHGGRVNPNQEIFLRINNGQYHIGSWDGGIHWATAPMPAEDLGQWVYLVGVYDGTHWRIYRNGVEISSNPATVGAMQVDADWAIGANGSGTDRFFKGQMDEVSIWTRALSAAEISANYSRRLNGTESGLVGYWRFEDGLPRDFSPLKNHGTVQGMPQSVVPCPLPVAPISPRLWVGGMHRAKHVTGFSGRIADLQVWNKTRTATEVKNALYFQLTGNEANLVGYWRMGAIAVEENHRSVIDFSANCNHAVIYGDPFVSAVTLSRTLGNGRTKAIRFSNAELIAVSQRATYQESFEFKLDAAIDPNKVDENGERLFEFTCWGQANRNSDEKISIPVSQNPFVEIEKGWYRAECQFTIPDDVKFVRSFEVSNVKGKWKTLEVCKHRIRVTSNSVTQAQYTDTIVLVAIGDLQASLTAQFKELDNKQKQRFSLLAEIKNLKMKIDSTKDETALKNRIKESQAKLDVLKKEDERLRKDYELEQSTSLNYWCLLLPQQDPSTVARIYTQDRRLILSPNWRKDANVTRYWNTRFKFERVEAEKAYTISSYTSEDGKTHILTRMDGFFSGETESLLADSSKKYRQLWKITPASSNSDLYDIRSTVDGASIALYYDSLRRETNIVPWGVPANQQGQLWKFEIVSQRDTTNDVIDKAYKAWQEKLAEIAQAQQALLDLQEIAEDAKDQQNNWSARLAKAEGQELPLIEQSIAALNNQLLKDIVETQQPPIALPEVSKDSRGLTVKGAVLEFIRPASRLNLLETCEGNVQLSYLDEDGKIQLTQFDATADSRNGNCEQWIPNGIRTHLQLGTQASLEIETAIPLSNQWTVETWFSLPLPEQQWNTLPLPEQQWNTLLSTEAKEDFQVAVKDGRQLGFFADGQFYSCGYDLGQLPSGWHHLAIAGNTQSFIENATFYMDGVEVGKADSSLLSRSLKFNSKSDYVELPEETEQTRMDFSTGITVEAWVYYDGFEQWSRIIDFGSGRGIDNIALANYGTSRRLRFAYLQDGGGFGITTQKEVLEPNRWIHVAVTVSITGEARIYVNGAPQATDPADNSQNKPLEKFNLPKVIQRKKNYIGKSNWETDGYFNGKIAEVRIWTLARTAEQIQMNMHCRLRGNESGLAGYWYLDEEQIFRDHSVSSRNGQLRGTPTIITSSIKGSRSITRIGNTLGGDRSFGSLAEVRIWQVALSPEEIEINSKTVLSGNEPDLMAYYPLDQMTGEEVYDRAIGDASSTDYSGTLQGAYNWLPWSNPIGKIDRIDSRVSNSVVSVEYSTIGVDAGGVKSAMMRRFLAYCTPEGVCLLSGKRIETLEMKWIGNAQFEPTLLGYIEGPPPVPSENLTVNSDYNGATAVELSMAENVEYSWNREENYQVGATGSIFLGKQQTVSLSGGASLVGKISASINLLEVRGGAKGDISNQYSILRQSAISAFSGISMIDSLALRGTPEAEAKFDHLGKRFIPKNVGYALVVSGLADIYITRLKRSKKMVSYQLQPNQDIPLDVNTITFMINPAYTMNGSLDGLTGSSPTSDRFFREVPQMRSQYGSRYPASYYRLTEAYKLKEQIDMEDKKRESYFMNFNAHLVDPVSLTRQIPQVSDSNRDGQIIVTRTEDQKALNQAETEANKREKLASLTSDDSGKLTQQSQDKQAEINAKIADLQQRIHASNAVDWWQRHMENLQVLAGKRNIVNTYVWDADGGLRTESQQFANTVTHMVGGSYNMDAAIGVEAKLFVIGAGAELSAQATFNMTHTMTKTETSSKGFSLNVDLSGVESTGVTDYNDKPLLPGEKVSRYRFMSFYLESNTSHFYDFFNYVVDPEWLQGNSEEARALRQAKAGKANKAWRVLHRVTYVERPTLTGFGQDLRKLSARKEALPAQALVSRLEQLEKHNQELEAKVEQILQLLQSELNKKS